MKSLAVAFMTLQGDLILLINATPQESTGHYNNTRTMGGGGYDRCPHVQQQPDFAGMAAYSGIGINGRIATKVVVYLATTSTYSYM